MPGNASTSSVMRYNFRLVTGFSPPRWRQIKTHLYKEDIGRLGKNLREFDGCLLEVSGIRCQDCEPFQLRCADFYLS
jgi:hypothetical protein